MKANTSILVGKTFFWNGMKSFKIEQIKEKKYLRSYFGNNDAKPEWMPLDSLLKCIKDGKYTCSELSRDEIKELTSSIVSNMDRLNRQADKIGNYGRI